MSDPNNPPPPPGGTPPPPGPPTGGFGTPPPPGGPGGQVPPPSGFGGQAPPPGGFGNQPPGGFQSPPGGASSGASGVGEAFQYGWTKFQQNIGELLIAVAAWIGAIILASVLIFALMAVVGAIGSKSESIGFFGMLILMSVGMLLVLAANFIGGAALMRVGLLSTKGEPLTTKNLFSTENFSQYVLTSLLTSAIIGVGMFFCYVPGYVAMFFLFFAPYYALDKGIGPMEAMRASVTVVNRNIAASIVLLIGASIAYTIGLILCGIGVLVAFPVILIAYAHMYRQFNGEPIAP